MKQQIDNSSSVTKKDLQEALAIFEKNLDKKYATKEDLKQELKKHPTKGDMRRAFEKAGYELDEKLKQLRSDFYTKVDPFLKEIENAREDRAITTTQIEKMLRILTTHETRINRLEHKQSTN